VGRSSLDLRVATLNSPATGATCPIIDQTAGADRKGKDRRISAGQDFNSVIPLVNDLPDQTIFLDFGSQQSELSGEI
jgi:hypothetical protein